MTDNLLRVAVVGAGPSGLYTTTEIVTRCSNATVDLYDRLPTPGGLARYGVAPDHHERRRVISVNLRMALATGRFQYFGNVEIGVHISVTELGRHYHAVVYAYGASDERRLAVPGEELPGVHSAADFVGWYNGHPDCVDLTFDLSCHTALVIGNGNVALDVARILLLGANAVRSTDIADHALEALAASSIKEVVVVGRRGPGEAAHTATELIGLGELDARICSNVEPAEAAMACEAGTRAAEYARQLKAKVMSDLLRASESSLSDKQLVFQFLSSPVEILGEGRVESVRLSKNELKSGSGGKVVAHPTDESFVLPTRLVFRSVGYRGRVLRGLPFDEDSAVVPNRRGRIIDPTTNLTKRGNYVTGWIKRGASGVIGSNKICASETVDALLDDFEAGLLFAPTALDIADRIGESQPEYIGLQDWAKIDHAERAAGESVGRPRRKLVTVDEMVAAAGLSH